jgi:hypothetical protein
MIQVEKVFMLLKSLQVILSMNVCVFITLVKLDFFDIYESVILRSKDVNFYRR